MLRFFQSLVLSVIFLCGTTSPIFAEEATSPSTGKVELSQEVDLSQMRGFLDQLDGDVQKAMPGFSLVRIFDDLKSGKLSLRPENIGNTLLALLGHQILGTAPLIGKLLILAVLGAVLG